MFGMLIMKVCRSDNYTSTIEHRKTKKLHVTFSREKRLLKPFSAIACIQ